MKRAANKLVRAFRRFKLRRIFENALNNRFVLHQGVYMSKEHGRLQLKIVCVGKLNVLRQFVPHHIIITLMKGKKQVYKNIRYLFKRKLTLEEVKLAMRTALDYLTG
jgi:hypothetical protein